MIKKIESSKVVIPPIFLVETEEDFEQLPRGVPYIIGKEEDLEFIRTYLEFQILIKSCNSTNIPIKWLDCLKQLGYNVANIREYQLKSGGGYGDNKGDGYNLSTEDFITDQYLVNFDELTSLKLLPSWLDDIVSAINTNLIDEVMFNPMAFNKQLGLNIGAAQVKTNPKNLLILDISSSMPKAVVMTITRLAKLMSKRFYADIILTGKESYLYDYNVVQTLDIIGITSKIGGGNEGTMYKKIVSETKFYDTIISFGDDDSPGIYNGENRFICNTLYNLHTEKNSNNITGYAKSLAPKKDTIRVKDWLRTISL